MKVRQLSYFFRLLILVSLGACGGETEIETEATRENESVPVNVMHTNIETLPRMITYSGSLEAWETAFISGQSGVRIDRIHVNEGDFVKEGQLLATMNATQFTQAQLQVDMARREIQRIDTLVKIGSVSGQQMDQARNELENAENNLQNLLENTELRAPFGGVITGRYFSRGEMFAQTADKPAILTLMQIDPIKLTVQVAEQNYMDIQEGIEAEVLVDIFPGQRFSGKVYKKHPQIDTGTRTFEVEVSMPNPKMIFKPGMFARVNINLGSTTGIFVPSYAVLSQPGTSQNHVFVVKGNQVSRLTVEVGTRYEDLIKVEEGLDENERLVVEGMQRLVDGSTVRIIEASQQEN